MGTVIGAIIFGIVATACFVIAYLQFREKGILLNNTYIYSSNNENKTPYYRQSGIVFTMIGSVFLINMLEIILKTGWLFYLVILVAVIVSVYAIASTVAISKNK